MVRPREDDVLGRALYARHPGYRARRGARGRKLRGVAESELATRCEDWFARYVERYISPEGRAAVVRHQGAGDVCAIVTGASPYAARPLARRLEIQHVVSTVFELDASGRFTGRPEPPCASAKASSCVPSDLRPTLAFASRSQFFTRIV